MLSRIASSKPASQPLAATGIEGFDHILGGGLTANRLYLIEGKPGSGKTTLALQFLREGEEQPCRLGHLVPALLEVGLHFLLQLGAQRGDFRPACFQGLSGIVPVPESFESCLFLCETALKHGQGFERAPLVEQP